MARDSSGPVRLESFGSGKSPSGRGGDKSAAEELPHLPTRSNLQRDSLFHIFLFHVLLYGPGVHKRSCAIAVAPVLRSQHHLFRASDFLDIDSRSFLRPHVADGPTAVGVAVSSGLSGVFHIPVPAGTNGAISFPCESRIHIEENILSGNFPGARTYNCISTNIEHGGTYIQREWIQLSL